MRASTVSTLDLPEIVDAPPSRIVTTAQAGMRLGRYLLLQQLARGGMAEVWIGSHSGPLGFRRLVAIKTIRPDRADDPATRKMFLDEARIAARLRHSNVVEVLDLGEVGDLVYQVMPLVEGDSLAGLLRRLASFGERMPLAIAIRIVIDACRGLHAAHELRDDAGAPLALVHRDVSPQNILVGSDGVAKIADFGVAKALGRLADETMGSHLRGKLAYLSPEQAHHTPLDRRSDLFSVGTVLWEAVTGRRLFRGRDEVDTIDRVRTLVIPDPRSVAPEVPAEIAMVTMRALSRNRDERFATSDDMADALEAAARASGLLASAKDTARLVVRLAGPDITSRRALASPAAAAETAVEIAPRAERVGTVVMEPAVRRSSRSRWVLGVSLAAITIAFATAAMVRMKPIAAKVQTIASVPAATVSLTPPSTAEPATVSSFAAASAPLPTAVSSHRRPTTTKSVPAVVRAPAPAAPNTSKPQVPFPSPYGP